MGGGRIVEAMQRWCLCLCDASKAQKRAFTWQAPKKKSSHVVAIRIKKGIALHSFRYISATVINVEMLGQFWGFTDETLEGCNKCCAIVTMYSNLADDKYLDTSLNLMKTNK